MRVSRISFTARSAFIHKSPIPTLYFQDSLLRLPIPSLEETLNKYLYFIEPLVSQQAFVETTRRVNLFRSSSTSSSTSSSPTSPAGPDLQAQLLEWDKQHPKTSYISELWYDSYLSARDPLPLNLNPQLTWRDVPTSSSSTQEGQQQAVRAANLIYASTRFYLTLQEGVLEPDVFHTKEITKNRFLQHTIATVVPKRVASYPMYALGAYPLDMSQYARLFQSTRIPHRVRDELYTCANTTTTSDKFIIIMCSNKFYKVNVTDANSNPIAPDVLETHIRSILADAAATTTTSSHQYSIASLTGAHRDVWADARQELAAFSPTNAKNLRCIDDALFVVTLDEASPKTHEEVSRVMLHGGETGTNRWFDKCFNLIVCKNGKSGVNWEHSWGDGAAVLYFFNAVHRVVCSMPERKPSPDAITMPKFESDTSRASSSGSGSSSSSSLTSRLHWDLSPSLCHKIRDVETAVRGTIADTELRVFQTPSLTKADIKKSNLSPDGVMQMALQLAHWRAHAYTPVTYESASTAAYKHGRTETIRSATPLSVEMCKVFGNRGGVGVGVGVGVGSSASSSSSSKMSESDAAKRFAALQAATVRHRKTSLDAVMGKGVDRHLFALQHWARRRQQQQQQQPQELPEIFTDPSYAHFKDIRLSTSTLASDALDGGGFGPVSLTSYGVGYGVEERGSHFHIMCYKDTNNRSKPSGASTLDFGQALESALRDFHEVIAIVMRGQGNGK